jgi:hypothetical protein
LQPDCDTKAELNRRGQACGVLTGTGISRRENDLEAVNNFHLPFLASDVKENTAKH